MCGCWGHRVGCLQTSQCNNLTLLLIGIENAGKTTVLNSLKGDLHNETVPTYGFSAADISTTNCKFKVYDLGGSRNIRRIWTIYMSEVHGIIYVVDAADVASFEQARTALHQLLQAPQLAGKPVLVLANKQDLPNAQPSDAVAKALGLGQLQKNCNPHHTLPCTARAAGQQQPDPILWQGLQWLRDSIHPIYAQLQAKLNKESAEAKAEEQRRRRDREDRAKQSKLERLAMEIQQKFEQQPQQELCRQHLEQSLQSPVSTHQSDSGPIRASCDAKHCEPAESANSTLGTLQNNSSSGGDGAIPPAAGTACHETTMATAQLPGAPEAIKPCADGCLSGHVVGSIPDDCRAAGCCTSVPELESPVGLVASSSSTAGHAHCPTAMLGSLVEQGRSTSSLDAEAINATSSSSGQKRAGSVSPSTSSLPATGSGRQLLGLLLQALPGAVAAAAGTSTAFSDLKQAAYEECGPTPRTYSITSDASSLLVSEPSHQHRPSAQSPVGVKHTWHVPSHGKGASNGAHIAVHRHASSGVRGGVANCTRSPVQEGADAGGSGPGMALASRTLSMCRSGQSNRVQPS